MCPCPDPRPAARLSLSHCFGYDGDVSRHGHSLQGRNLLLLSLHLELDLDQGRGPSDHLLFPAAAVVVLMDTESRRQRCACPTLPCPALLCLPSLLASSSSSRPLSILVHQILHGTQR